MSRKESDAGNSGNSNNRELSAPGYASASELGKVTDYKQNYSPALLHRIARKDYRETLFSDCGDLDAAHLSERLAAGVDVWHAYEVSCLLNSGLPINVVAKIQVPASSQYIVESKSLKLYFNSWNNCRVASKETLQGKIVEDLTRLLGQAIVVDLLEVSKESLSFDFELGSAEPCSFPSTPATLSKSITKKMSQDSMLLDDQDVVCDIYNPDASILKSMQGAGAGIFHSHLLRSNCPVTNQPDWATLVVAYDNHNTERAVTSRRRGSYSENENLKTLCPASLLRYIVSYREHNGFHEQTIEKIFLELLSWGCESLFVAGLYTRRGGIDITPIRSTGDISVELSRFNRL